MQNQGGITDIILQEMAWLIILMTIHEQPLSHENEWGLLILFFFFYQDVMQLQNRKKYLDIMIENYDKRIMFCYILHQLYLIIRMIRKFPEYML